MQYIVSCLSFYWFLNCYDPMAGLAVITAAVLQGYPQLLSYTTVRQLSSRRPTTLLHRVPV